MIGFVTDRTQGNVTRRNELAQKGWSAMTAEEQAEWTGDPLLAEGANLLPLGENYSSSTTVKYRNDAIYVTSNWDGTYIYAVLAVGSAADYAGKTMTLSLDSLYSTKGSANILLYWHDANGAEYAGGGLTEAGSMTFTLTENTANRDTLAIYLYATTDTEIAAGDFILYRGLMLEFGSVRHAYVPYYAILPTAATKGAYNYSDLNRVETAITELAADVGISLDTKTDWAAWDLPKQADGARILANLNTLRMYLPLSPVIPATPVSMEKLTVNKANDIEKILEALTVAVDTTYRSGELYAGEI